MSEIKTHDIILVKQFHEADKAGPHTDWRVVIGNRAHSWATKKDVPNAGDKIVLWEQPVHDKEYAMTEKIVHPPGSYGAGVSTQVYAQRGTADVLEDTYKLKLGNGDSYLIKKMPNFGVGAWLLVNTTKKKEEKEENGN